jgi:hypothetical protein
MRPARSLLLSLSALTLTACYAAQGPPPADAPTAPPAAAIAAPEKAAAPSTAPPNEGTLADEGFTLISDEHGVKVYRREKRPGIELAAVGDIAASPEQVRRVLIDYPSHPRWQPRLAENRVLASGEGSLDVYQRLSLPVLDDRDFTLHVTWGSEGEVLWMRFASAPDRGPPAVSGVVRVVDHDGGWRLEPRASGQRTHAVYRFHLDLAGSFPSWMGKGRAADDVTHLFDNIEKQLPAYR